ncbi:MAG TPA: MBL fold metallo-hydrolase [Methanotrichaceae archaeon]|nr:MBL fold metallo-hydrolase [Methanotrichaceae archaeon]
MIEPMRSQPIAGSRNTAIYPYIRKIDLMSSNSYIISGVDHIALIDPGGLEDQINHLEGVVAGLQEELLRPVVIYLTHVHMDHWVQLKQGRKHKNLSEAALAVQALGANALETQDPRVTLSGLLGRSMIKVPVELKLLSPRDLGLGGERHLSLGKWTYDYAVRSRKIYEEMDLQSIVVPMGKGDHLEIYHTPGHSPDSICMQIGSVLVVGDLFFAPNPGMAGAYGWSQKDLVQSIQKVLWILENKNIQVCCSGHGRPVDAWTARKTLEVMYNDASSLQGLEEITPEWAKRTAAYALDLMAEMERISTIIAGRLAFIAHVLGELEEAAEAEEMDALIDPQLLDDLFDDFYSFSMALSEGKKLDLEFVHKAGQTVGKLEKLFERKLLGSIMDQSLLGRASRLINDYSMTYRGFRPPYYVSYEDVNRIIGKIMEDMMRSPYDEEAILLAESVEDYLMALKTRIAYVNLFENASLTFEPDPQRPFARMDKERFSDALIDILERFVGAGSKWIKVTTSQNDDWVLIRISGSVSVASHPLERARRFFERSLALCGGLLQTSLEEDGPMVEIEFSALGEELAF